MNIPRQLKDHQIDLLTLMPYYDQYANTQQEVDPEWQKKQKQMQ